MELVINIEKDSKRMGFTQEFMSGKTGDYKFELLCGAGCGNSLLFFHLTNTKTGKFTVDVADIKPLFSEWVKQRIGELENGEKIKT